MYMILFPQKGMCSGNTDGIYQSLFTDDLHRVSGALREPGVSVYKLDGLTRITQVEITYQEITEETSDG